MCFSLQWVAQILVLAVIVGAVLAILNIFVPWVMGKIGPAFAEIAAMLASILRIVFWAFVCIVAIYIVFGLIACLLTHVSIPSLIPR